MNVVDDALEPIRALVTLVFFVPAQYALNILSLDGGVEVGEARNAKLGVRAVRVLSRESLQLF